MATDESDRHVPTGRGEKLLPDDLGTRKASSEGEEEGPESHSRAKRDGQLEELSKAVKSTRMKGRIGPFSCADRTRGASDG